MKEIIDVTKCNFNTFDGGASQRTKCTLDNCFCDGIRNKDCYYKQLKRLEQEKAKYYQQTLDDEIQINELLQTLQEIKEIAEFHITEADSEDVQNDMKQIIDLITKAEEE